jgi:hypothetical protein
MKNNYSLLLKNNSSSESLFVGEQNLLSANEIPFCLILIIAISQELNIVITASETIKMMVNKVSEIFNSNFSMTGMKHSETKMPHSDATVSQSDATVSYPEAGVSHPDAGVSHPDAGVSHPDAGASHLDGGVNHLDAGVSHLDAGVSRPSVEAVGNSADNEHYLILTN